MSTKPRKSYSREFKMEAVGLITEKGYSIAEASRIGKAWKGVGPRQAFGFIGKRSEKDLISDPISAFLTAKS